MENIFLDRAGAEDCISKMNAAIGKLSEAGKEIDAAMVALRENYWKGNAAASTEARYSEQYKPMLTKNVPDAVEQLKNFINDAKKSIEAVDEQLTGK